MATGTGGRLREHVYLPRPPPPTASRAALWPALWPALLAALTCICILLLPAPIAAAGGYEETELRLKNAGIDEGMREEIHTAIRRGVARLRALQLRRGNIAGTAGQTVLAGLALRHAAIPDGVEGAERAINWLLKRAPKTVRNSTYEAGIMCMLLQAAGSHPKVLRRIHAQLAKGARGSAGYWGYASAGGKPPSNLSTAQFACLGLWAAERAGAPRADKTWRLHVEALLRAQGDGGSWGYQPRPGQVAGAPVLLRRPYPTGTFMGLANLLLAEQALKEALTDEPELHARMLIARAKALAALRRHVQWVLVAPGQAGPLLNMPLYRLYALEKVCIFSSLEDVGGVQWYREGARVLLDTQAPDGGWPRLLTAPASRRRAPAQSSAQDTSLALLFLLRTSASYHPTTPRPVDTRRVVVTPHGAEPTAPEPAAPAAAPPLMSASKALTRLEAALRRDHLRRLAPLRDALLLVRRTYAAAFVEGAFASPGHAAWAARAERLLLAYAVRFTTAKAAGRLLWQALSLDALESLAGAHSRVGRPLMKLVLEREPGNSFRPDFAFGWYGAAIDALRRLRPPGLAAWLGTRALSPDLADAWRSSATLCALGGMAEELSGSLRYVATRSIFTRMQPVLTRSLGNLAVRALVRDVRTAVQRLARGSKALALPQLEGATLKSTGPDLLRWWARHRKSDDPLWQD